MTCNNILFNALKIECMHDSMVKLYKIAKDAKGIVGQSAVARALNESPQTVKNWETRGISKNGAIKAQETFGCNANDLLRQEVEISGVKLRIQPEQTLILHADGNVNESHTFMVQETKAIDERRTFNRRQTGASDKWTNAALEIMKSLDEAQKQAMVARMREFKQYLGPPNNGQALSVAG